MMVFIKTKKILSIMLSLALMCSLFAGLLLPGNAAATGSESGMYVGVGKGDITGPITEISTGYNSVGDVMQGLLMRLYARAFVVAQGDTKLCYVSAEMVHMTESIKPGVLKELAARGITDFSDANLMLAATHCHSATSNSSWYPLYSLINGVSGFDSLYYEIVVKGIADAIAEANSSLVPGSVSMAQGEIEDATNNRSLDAYLANKGADPDATVSTSLNDTMTLLRFSDATGKGIGALNWFASHGTSNSIDNTYVASDHKGYAAYQMEQQLGIVSAFSQNESGDASPNKAQADYHADFLRPNQLDETLDIIENEIVAGTAELEMATKLYDETQSLGGEVDYRFANVEFSDIKITDTDKYIGEYHMEYDDIENAATSVPCIGAGIIAGDEEGAPVDNAAEGALKHEYTRNDDGTWTQQPADFTKLDLSGLEKLFKPLWKPAMILLNSNGYDEAQAEKLVRLNVSGFMQTIQPLQIFRIGSLAIVGVPFELTTMQARRTAEVLRETLADAGVTDIVFSTLTNSYSQYVTTREEYAAQHYEGATCLFGPWSGAALTQELDKLALAMAEGTAVDAGPVPEDRSATPGIQTAASTFGVVRDAGIFGKVLTNVKKSYKMGETVTAVFQAASPRTAVQLRADGRLGDDYTYMAVEKLGDDGRTWEVFRTDADPYTTFRWERPTMKLSAYSTATVGWLLKDETIQPGTYRLRYNGIAKNAFGMCIPFTKASGSFTVS